MDQKYIKIKYIVIPATDTKNISTKTMASKNLYII